MLREVFHITKKELIPSIEKGGLKTLQQQSNEGSIDLDEHLRRKYNWRAKGDSELIDFYINTLYFSLEKPPTETSWVSFIVEDSVEDVLNNRLEFQGFDTYMRSRMKFIDFLQKSRGKILLDPITAQVISEDDIEPKGDIPKWQLYLPEVIIQRNCIRELAKFHIGKF